jgi:hypothetical protein
VLAWLKRGRSEKEIAARLDISIHTVHSYTKLLYRRFDAVSRGELLAIWAAERWAPRVRDGRGYNGARQGRALASTLAPDGFPAAPPLPARDEELPM